MATLRRIAQNQIKLDASKGSQKTKRKRMGWSDDYLKDLFGLINEDIKDLNASDVDKIEISIEYDEVKVVVELNETETIEECGKTEVVNKVIEIEADLEELETLTDSGDIEFVGEIEQDDTTLKEFVYSGSFKITGDKLELELEGEYDDDETGKKKLILEK